MEHSQSMSNILAHYIAPAFFVENGTVIQANSTAQALMVTAGTEIFPLITAGEEEYRAFTHGCLSVTLLLMEEPYSADITAEEGAHLFVCQSNGENSPLQAYALAARELRAPLAEMMMLTKRLFRDLPENSDDAACQQAAAVNQSMHQMLRLVSNMSDAGRFVSGTDVRREYANITQVLQEMLEQIQSTCDEGGIDFQYSCPENAIYGPIDRDKLERGVYNLISNAIKFGGKEAGVEVTVKASPKRLYITVKDNGSGIPQGIRQTLYQRYRRMPGLEDASQGIGLGIVVAKGAAAMHGGALLMEILPDAGTKITMSISLETKDMPLRSPVMRIDYTGHHAHCLVELADSLPAQLYAPKLLN